MWDLSGYTFRATGEETVLRIPVSPGEARRESYHLPCVMGRKGRRGSRRLTSGV